MRLRFNRRARPPDPAADHRGDPTPDPGPSTAGPDHAGHALRAPSKLHAFNRYEIKYLVATTEVAALRRELAGRLDLDATARDGGYGVWSVYYDTPSCGSTGRRSRGCGSAANCGSATTATAPRVDDDTPVYVEIKQRVNRVTQKRRVALPYRLARRLCDEPGAGRARAAARAVRRGGARPGRAGSTCARWR